MTATTSSPAGRTPATVPADRWWQHRWFRTVAGKVIYRLLGLPRRDWPPRPDELPRAVRIPKGRGDYLLPKTFAEAETQRAAWCINPDHQHPYTSWSDARLAGCASNRTRLAPPS